MSFSLRNDKIKHIVMSQKIQSFYNAGTSRLREWIGEIIKLKKFVEISFIIFHVHLEKETFLLK